jgi:5-methylthioadenosine/S-adenosylhomocysteine deaminase
MGSDVDTVIIDGNVVMRGRKLLTIDEEEAMSKAEGVADELVERSKIGYLKRREWPR